MIKKAIIPVAGLATRFLPASKVVPKTMFPIGNRTIIHILVEEAVSAGVEEIAIIICDRQNIIKDYFRPDEFLEKELSERDKTDKYALVRGVHEMAKIHFFTQEKLLGDGHALLSAYDFIDDGESFLVIFCDEFISSNGKNATSQLVDCHGKVGVPIIGVHAVEDED